MTNDELKGVTHGLPRLAGWNGFEERLVETVTPSPVRQPAVDHEAPVFLLKEELDHGEEESSEEGSEEGHQEGRKEEVPESDRQEGLVFPVT